MSASTLNLGQKQKGYEALQKLKWVKQIMQPNSLKMMVSEMASLGSNGFIQFPTYPSLPYLT